MKTTLLGFKPRIWIEFLLNAFSGGACVQERKDIYIYDILFEDKFRTLRQ